MKLPRLKTGRGDSGGGPQPPKLLSDLYADLRDRRLLPLVALLIVAVAAVPFLLGGKSDEEIPVEVPPVASAPSSHADFSVVPASQGLRDYRERLGHREPRNPFGSESNSSSSETAGSTDSTGEPVEGSGAPTESSATTPPSGGSEPGYEVEVTESGGSEPSPEKPTVKTEVKVKNQIVDYGLTAKLGYLPKLEERDGLRPMTKLPNPKKPVLVYVGPSQAKDGALLLMTSDVTAFYGDVKCVLGGQNCQVVEVKEGKSATFAYGYGDAHFKVIIKKLEPLVHVVESDAKVEAEGGKRRH